MSFRSAIVSQFARPRGVLGRVVGWILAGRGSNLARNRWTVDLVDPKEGDLVLEVGCGPGVALSLCLARQGVRAVGVDHSGVMIAQAGKRNAAAVKASRLALVEGTLDSLPATAGPFDKVYSINVIQFVDQRAFVARAKQLMKPGSVLATTYQPREVKPTREGALKMAAQVSALLAAEGFTAIRTEELALKPAPAVCVLARRG